jgi:hypothetical protein
MRKEGVVLDACAREKPDQPSERRRECRTADDRRATLEASKFKKQTRTVTQSQVLPATLKLARETVCVWAVRVVVQVPALVCEEAKRMIEAKDRA